VDSVSDGVLTLIFAREGEAKGFTGSGCDQDLARVLQAMFGTAPQIRTASGHAGNAGSGGHARAAPGAGRPGQARPQGQQPGAGQAGAGRAGGSRAGAGRTEGSRRPEPPAPPDDFPDDVGGDDGGRAGPGGEAESLTGMDLIQHELGGRVIEELGD